MCLCDCIIVRLCACVVMYLCVCVDARMFECVNVWLCGCVIAWCGAWLCVYVNVCLRGSVCCFLMCGVSQVCVF